MLHYSLLKDFSQAIYKLQVDGVGKFILSPLSGLGFGLIYLPAITGVAAYFDKKRAMAIGIASSGAGFGTLIFAPVRNLLNENFGWSWTLMLNGALVIFCIPLGLLFKPIKAKKSHQSTETCEETDGGGNWETHKLRWQPLIVVDAYLPVSRKWEKDTLTYFMMQSSSFLCCQIY